VSELDWIGCELYNLGSYWIFLLWIMDVDPFPRIYMVILVIYCLAKEETQRSFKEKEKGVVKKMSSRKEKGKRDVGKAEPSFFITLFFISNFFFSTSME
jgi:hypothetical protein